MKKIIIIAAALLTALSANAQVGIVAGVTSSASNVKSAYADYKNISQYHVGLTYKLGIGNLLAIQPAILYNMKGETISNIANTGDLASVEYKTGYLEVPVQVQVGVGVGSLLRVYGFAEPFIGYAITNQQKGTIASKEDVQKTWDNMKSRFEYGVSLGAGVEVLRHLQVSVKYFWNLGDVYGSEINFNTIKTTISESKCNGVAASVAFLF